MSNTDLTVRELVEELWGQLCPDIGVDEFERRIRVWSRRRCDWKPEVPKVREEFVRGYKTVAEERAAKETLRITGGKPGDTVLLGELRRRWRDEAPTPDGGYGAAGEGEDGRLDSDDFFGRMLAANERRYKSMLEDALDAAETWMERYFTLLRRSEAEANEARDVLNYRQYALDAQTTRAEENAGRAKQLEKVISRAYTMYQNDGRAIHKALFDEVGAVLRDALS